MLSVAWLSVGCILSGILLLQIVRQFLLRSYGNSHSFKMATNIATCEKQSFGSYKRRKYHPMQDIHEIWDLTIDADAMENSTTFDTKNSSFIGTKETREQSRDDSNTPSFCVSTISEDIDHDIDIELGQQIEMNLYVQ